MEGSEGLRVPSPQVEGQSMVLESSGPLAEVMGGVLTRVSPVGSRTSRTLPPSSSLKLFAGLKLIEQSSVRAFTWLTPRSIWSRSSDHSEVFLMFLPPSKSVNCSSVRYRA